MSSDISSTFITSKTDTNWSTSKTTSELSDSYIFSSSSLTDSESTAKNDFQQQLINFLKEEFCLTNVSSFRAISDGIHKFMRHLIKKVKKDERNLIQTSEIIAKYEPQISTNINIQEMTEKIKNLEAENTILQNQVNCYRQDNIEVKVQLQEILEENKKIHKQLLDRSNDSGSSQAQIFVIQTDLENKKKQCKELTSVCKQRKEKIKQMLEIIDGLSKKLKEKDQQNDSLKMQLDKALFDKDELNTKLQSLNVETLKSRLELKEQEIESLKKVINALADQVNDINQDLSKEDSIKTRMLRLLNRITLYFTSIEKNVEKLTKDNNTLKDEKENLQNQNKDLQNTIQNFHCDHNEVCESLREFIKENYSNHSLINDMKDILSPETHTTVPPIKRIENLLNLLLKQKLEKKIQLTPNEEFLKGQNRRLIIYLNNIVHFLEQIVQSGEIQHWLLDGVESREFPQQMKQQVIRIQSFLESNNLIDNSQIADSFMSFPSFIDKYLEKSLFERPDNDVELLTLVEQFIFINSILVKFSSELQHRGNLMISEVRTLRAELNKAQNEIYDSVENVRNQYESQIQNEIQSREKMEKTLNAVKNKLRENNNLEVSDIVTKCLSIINENNQINESNDNDTNSISNDIESYNSQNDEYVTKVENKLAEAMDKIKKQKNEHEKEVEELKVMLSESQGEIDDIKQKKEIETKELEKEINELKKKLSELAEDKEKLQNEFLNEHATNKQINSIVKQQQQQIDLLKKQKEDEKEEIKKQMTEDYEKQKKALARQVDDLKQEYLDVQTSYKQEIRDIKKGFKQERTKYVNEIDLQIKRIDEIKKHYEALLSELREKVKEARDNEMKHKGDYEKQTVELNDLRSRNSSLQLEQKVLQMKLNSFEERLKREKALIESKSQMKYLALETNKQTAIEEQKVKQTSQFNKFLLQIYEKIQTIIDITDNNNITEQTTLDDIDKIVNIIYDQKDQIESLSQITKEVDDIKEFLLAKGCDLENKTLYQAVKDVYDSFAKMETDRQEIAKEKKEVAALKKQAQTEYDNLRMLKEWEDWARRLHILISDSFAAKIETSRELRNDLEEVLIASISNRQTFRKLDTLRLEKQFLVSNMLRPVLHKAERPHEAKFNVALIVVSSVLRIQKLSGHMRCSHLSTPQIDGQKKERRPQNKNPSTPQPSRTRWPFIR